MLPDVDTIGLYEVLKTIPRRHSPKIKQRLQAVRREIYARLRELWEKTCLKKLQFRLPLLILDEAHHLKNARTRLASLFFLADAEKDAEEISRGPLGGIFERMLFLTATPFQLGHGELCSVLERFDGICWNGPAVPPCGRQGFNEQIKDLRERLDAAQIATVRLDDSWGKLKPNDLMVNDEFFPVVAEWWTRAHQGGQLTARAENIMECYRLARERMSQAEGLLCPWVIRHLKSRQLTQWLGTPRRLSLPGQAICNEGGENDTTGIGVEGKSLLPFLLAARATACAPKNRPVFAEGLASSYEAFLHTRQGTHSGQAEYLDIDDHGTVEDNDNGSLDAHLDTGRWYLDQLEMLIPRGDQQASGNHPKIAATVRRVAELWQHGEKVVVFCHYVATGKTLRQRISEAIKEQMTRHGAEGLECTVAEVDEELWRIGRLFYDKDSPVRRSCDYEVTKILCQPKFATLASHREKLIEIVRSNIRTPAFLTRFFPLSRGRYGEEAMLIAMDRRDQSGMSMRVLLEDFFEFLMHRCVEDERQRYLAALDHIVTGSYRGLDASPTYEADELQGERAEVLLPNVRLVNGTTKSDTRQRLMLTFNTPFFPDVLIASSVMAEGVDLHLNCRHIIHHDLCWNPSTLEQRTGRIDRIGAKVERCGQPIRVYLPYIAETQDEKMYRVVMDRERWFSVVMGEEYRVDAQTTEKLANRIPLPEKAATDLAFRLEVK